MPCEKYEIVLREAASSGATLPTALQSHVDICAACRTAFAAEQALFAAIDGGLRGIMNEELPASLLAEVRLRVAEETVPKYFWRNWAAAFAAATVVATLLVTQGMWRKERKPADREEIGPGKQEELLVQSLTQRRIPTRTLAEPPPVLNRVPPLESRTSRQPAKPSEPIAAPEVLLAPGEEQALARYVVSLRRHDGGLQLDAEKNSGPLEVTRIAIAKLQLEPLGGPSAKEDRN